MPGKLSELATRLTAALAWRTNKLEVLDASDTTMAPTGTNKHMMLEDVLAYVEQNTKPWKFYRGREGFWTPQDTGYPFQTVFSNQSRDIREWRPTGTGWGIPVLGSPSYLRCDLLSPIPFNDYEVTFYSAPQWADAAASPGGGVCIQLGSTLKSNAEGGYFYVRDIGPEGADDGAAICGGATNTAGPVDSRRVRFGRWDGLCHVQLDGAEKTSATNYSTWNGTGPIYIGGAPGGNSWGKNSVAYSFSVRRRSTGQILASWDPTHSAITAGKVWVDPQGNTWTQVGTPVQTSVFQDWVVVGNTVAQAYNTVAELNAGNPYPEGGILANLDWVGARGQLMMFDWYEWTPLGIGIFDTVAQRDAQLTSALAGAYGTDGIAPGSLCVTLDTYTIWQRVNGAWVPRALAQSGLEAAKVTAPGTALAGLRYYATDTKRDWMWDGTGWIVMGEPRQIFTPTVANITAGSGILSASYQRRNGYCLVQFQFTFGAGSAVGTSPAFTVPFNHWNLSVDLNGKTCELYDSDVTTRRQGWMFASGQTAVIGYATPVGSLIGFGTVNATTPFTWATNDHIFAQFEYTMSSPYL